MANRTVAAVLVVSAAMVLSGCGATRVISVNCGGEKTYVDKAGIEWVPGQELEDDKDWGAVGGMVVDRDPVEIPGTDSPAIYLTERYGMDSYEFKLAPGTYTLRLHFAETWDGITGAAERVFTVSVNGKEVLKDFDPFQEAGGLNKPVVKIIKGVSPAEGKIVIGFTENIQNPVINGIEVLKE